MPKTIQLDKLLILDIETVPVVNELGELSEALQLQWEKKVGRHRPEETNASDYFFERSGIYAEFGKVVCISFGIFRKDDQGIWQFRVKSIANNDELELLKAFQSLLNRSFPTMAKCQLCGHNIKEFDVPYLCRRMLVHGLELPPILNVSGKKPWEVNYVDTLHLWRFGDYKHYTSLALLTAIFGIPTPKDDIDGSDVGKVYWKDGQLDRIVTYCQKDVVAVAQLLLKLRGEPLLENKQVIEL